MSRIGRAPVVIPSGVTVDIKGNVVSIKGPKGQLTQTIRPEIAVEQKDGKIGLVRKSDDRMVRSLHGLSRTLVANMIKGVTVGFQTELEIVGVGYRAQMEGKKLIMQLGYSHPVEVEPPKGTEIAVGKGNVITVSGIDKQAVGDLAAFIRDRRPPEVYKGKGVKYAGEYIRRKAGKAAAKKK
ncbi:MAG: 50S ribosomal protein L6 [Candidatus Melainabacteria bacterium]|nr:MAG: 50S ribosomal protein L6 [Candidatus Melainabacteria bacterium]